MIDEFNLTPNQLDAMREIGNVGAGNAATALSQVLNKKIDMNVPKVSLIPIEEVPDLVGGPDSLIVAVFLRVYGKAPGNILFLMPKENAFFMVDDLMGRPHGTTQELGEMEVSALKEVGNILTGSYLNSFFHFTNISMVPSIPSLALDMAGAFSWGKWAIMQWLSKLNSWLKTTALTDTFSSCPTLARWALWSRQWELNNYGRPYQSRHG